MRAVVDATQAPTVHVAVHLRRRERAVPEQLLDHAQVGAALEQVRGESVPEPVRVRNEAAQHARVQAAAAGGHKQRVLGPGGAGFAGGAPSTAGELAGWDVRDRLGEIDVPTLVIRGAYDLSTEPVSQTLVVGIRGARLVVFDESSHAPAIEETERYLQVVGDFMRQADAL